MHEPHEPQGLQRAKKNFLCPPIARSDARSYFHSIGTLHVLSAASGDEGKLDHCRSTTRRHYRLRCRCYYCRVLTPLPLSLPRC